MFGGLVDITRITHSKKDTSPYHLNTSTPYKNWIQLFLTKSMRAILGQGLNQGASHRKKHPYRLQPFQGIGLLLPLEPRIMFDGAAILTGAEVVQDQGVQGRDVQEHSKTTETGGHSDPLTDALDLPFALSGVTTPSSRQEIVFIDTVIKDYQTLLQGIDPNIEAVLLDPTQDGIEQMAEILKDRTDIDAVHVISHGNQGELYLGTGTLNLASMQDAYADELATIHQALTEDADLLIYGCNFGQGDAGSAAARLLAKLTGADLATSTDDTGSVQYGANWDLEYQTGTIDSQVVIHSATQEEWMGKLATINVTTFADVVDAGDGVTSLREAILQANAGSGGDTIVLGAGTYTLSIGVSDELAPDTTVGDLDIQQDVTIVGDSATTTIIDASGLSGTPDRIFAIHSNTATISRLTVQNGETGLLGGGGLWVGPSNTLTLQDAIVRDNTTTGNGGGVIVLGTAIMDRVTIVNNSANSGGGLALQGGSTTTVLNTTVSGNTAVGTGGAIFNRGATTLTNSTIAWNAGSDGINLGGSGSISLKNTILANHAGGNANAALTSLGNNIDSDGTALLGDPSDQNNVDPLLSVLANNGGATLTHALLTGSPAINAGNSTGAPAVDQRGTTRDATVDIGSYEFVASNAPILDLDANDSSGATGIDYQLTFTEGGSLVSIADTDAMLSDPDSTAFTSVTLTISGLLDGNTEILELDGSTFALATAVAGQNTSGGLYHVVITTGAGTANVTITKAGGGTWTLTQTETLVKAIQYQHTNTSTPTDGNRLIDVQVSDGALSSTTARTMINVNPVNDFPSFSGLDATPVFTEGGVAVILDANATIADPELDATNNYNGATLTLARNGGANADDRFSASGVTGSLTEGSSIMLGGTTIGTATTNSGGTLVITFNGNATSTLVDQLLNRLTYANASSNPPANVQIDFTFNDGNTGVQGSGSALDTTGSITITINSVNNLPTLDLDADNSSGAVGNNYQFTFTEGDGPTAIADSDASLIDLDSDTFANVLLTITGLQDGNAETLIIGGDTFALSTAVTGQDTADGNYHVVITTNAGTATVTITRQGLGVLTEAQVETLITSIRYQHTDTNTPTSGDRFVDVTVNDGSADSTAARGTIHVMAMNTPPTAAPDAFTVGEGSTTILNLASNDTDADDGLDLTSITIVAGPTNGTITQINTDGTVEYTHNGSEIPTDSFTYAINDLSGVTSNTTTVNITVTPQNDAPIIISDGGGPNASVSVLTDQTLVTIVTATDAESTPLTYSIIGGADAALFSIDTATGMLTFDNAPNIQTPSDVGGDNVYDVIVQASDGTATDTQAIAVTVTDIPVVVPPPPPDPSPEPPPPPDEGDKREESSGGGGFFVTGSQRFRPSSGSNSISEERKDSESFNISRGDNLLALQSINNKNTLGNAANKLFTLLQKEFETIDFKSEIQSLLNPSSGLLNGLDQARETLSTITETEKIYMVSSIAASTGLSVGYVVWLLRSGVLLTALLSTVPAWQFVNPLLVLDAPARKKNKRNQSEDDSLETMFEKPNKATPIPPEMKTGTIRQSRWPRQS